MVRQYGAKDEEEEFTPYNSSWMPATPKSRKKTATTSVVAPRIGSNSGFGTNSNAYKGPSLLSAENRTSGALPTLAKPPAKTSTKYQDLDGTILSRVVDAIQKKQIGKNMGTSLREKGGALGAGVEQLPSFGKSLSDYLAEAGDGSSLISGELSGMSAREQALRNQANLGDTKIAEIYAQLQNSMGQAGTDTAARYAAAGTNAQQVTDSTQANIAAARAKASAAQAEVAKNLGMTDVAPSTVDNNAAIDGANAASELATGGKSTRDYLATVGNAQQDFYKGNQAAAGYRGAEARTALQGDLTGRLAEIQDERSQLQSQAKEKALALAQAMYSADYGQFNDQRSYQDEREDTGYNRGVDQLQMENAYQQQMLESQSKSATPAYQQIQQSLEQTMPGYTQAALDAMSDARAAGAKGLDRKLLTSTYGIPAEYASLVAQMAQEYFKSYK